MTRMAPQFTPVVGTEIFDLRPDYSAISVVADGIDNVAHHPAVDRYVEESLTRPALPSCPRSHRPTASSFSGSSSVRCTQHGLAVHMLPKVYF
jgi:hypothetical protein